MKQKLGYKFLCICLLLSTHIRAQETASNCNFNVNEAINQIIDKATGRIYTYDEFKLAFPGQILKKKK